MSKKNMPDKSMLDKIVKIHKIQSSQYLWGTLELEVDLDIRVNSKSEPNKSVLDKSAPDKSVLDKSVPVLE